MEIFLDTANVDDVVLYKDFIDGVTTNPSLIAKSKRGDYGALISEICKLVSGSVSVEVTSKERNDVLAEARYLAKIHSNVCVKLPCTWDCLQSCRELSAEGISTNLTLCFSASQALLAAKCGATYVSPFLGRLEDCGHDGLALLEEITNIFEIQGYKTRVLAASVRNRRQVIQAALLGVGAITLPPSILKQCFDHPLTTHGLEIFERDWKSMR
ncbi:MAG: transaldolase family protein [Holosporaceae bacterium]|jgi:transaldolase|nr:transaldolase family protein [Holosporaceae bacterium]